MVFDLTYSDRMVESEITRMVGPPFGWFSKDRWGGIGSERCRIVASTGEIDEIFDGDYRRNFSNIEIRPKGIIVRIRYRLEVFAAVFSFPTLEVNETKEGLAIGNGKDYLVLLGSQGKPVKNAFREKIESFRSRGN